MFINAIAIAVFQPFDLSSGAVGGVVGHFDDVKSLEFVPGDRDGACHGGLGSDKTDGKAWICQPEGRKLGLNSGGFIGLTGGGFIGLYGLEQEASHKGQKAQVVADHGNLFLW